jgi:hypothetical protein
MCIFTNIYAWWVSAEFLANETRMVLKMLTDHQAAAAYICSWHCLASGIRRAAVTLRPSTVFFSAPAEDRWRGGHAN